MKIHLLGFSKTTELLLKGFSKCHSDIQVELLSRGSRHGLSIASYLTEQACSLDNVSIQSYRDTAPIRLLLVYTSVMNTIPYFQNMQHRLGPETQILLLNQGVSGTVNCYNILRRKGLRSQLFMGNLEFPRHADETRQTNCLVSIKLARLKDSENSSHLSHTADTLNMLETDLISVDKKELSLLLKDQLISASAIYIHMAREIIGAAVTQVDVLTFAKSKLGMSLVKDWEERVKHTAFFFPADTLVPLLYERLKWPKERLLEAIRADWTSPTTKLQKKHFTEVMFSVFSNWKKLEGIMPILLSMYATGKGGNVRHDMFY